MLKLPSRPKTPIWVGGALAALLTLTWAAEAFAQATVEEVVVVARYQGKELRSLKVPVSYRDLDLTTEPGRKTLKERVKATAAEACRRLGEAGAGETPMVPSCERGAVESAAQQMRVAIASAVPRSRP